MAQEPSIIDRGSQFIMLKVNLVKMEDEEAFPPLE